MPGLLIGYARVLRAGQDLTAHPHALIDLGVATERVYGDHGLTGTNRDRPGLRESLAACRAGDDTLVVTKLDRLGRLAPRCPPDRRRVRRSTGRPAAGRALPD